MINTTILCLSAVFLTRSPFSIVHLTSINSFSVDKSLFSRSLQNLFYFNINQGNVLFSNTVFNSILDCAILADSGYDARNVVFEKRFSPNIISGSYYSFESCLFQNCRSNRINGGAICIIVPRDKDFDVDISFEFSSFYKCSSQNGSGGAIYLYNFGHTSILETCFLECYASGSSSDGILEGSTVYINHRASTSYTRVRDGSFFSCPSDPNLCHKCDSVFKILSGKSEFTFSNFTNNYIEIGSSGISFIGQVSNVIDYSQFINCTGDNTIYIIGLKDEFFEIDTCNFINCVNHSISNDNKNNGILVVYYKQLIIRESVFMMNSNKFLLSTNNSNHYYYLFKNCRFDSSKDNLYDSDVCTYNNCTFSLINPSLNKYLYFDSKECWEIESHKLPNGKSILNKLLNEYLWITIVVGSIIVGLLIVLIVISINKCNSKNKNKLKANEFKSSELLSEPLLN